MENNGESEGKQYKRKVVGNFNKNQPVGGSNLRFTMTQPLTRAMFLENKVDKNKNAPFTSRKPKDKFKEKEKGIKKDNKEAVKNIPAEIEIDKENKTEEIKEAETNKENDIDKEKEKKENIDIQDNIVKSIKLLLPTLSQENLKEIENEINKLKGEKGI